MKPNAAATLSDSDSDGSPDDDPVAVDDDAIEMDEDISDDKLTALDSAVSNELYNYNNHKLLLRALRQAGELDRLRSARERMSLIFPLTPQLWLDWIKDEVSAESERNVIQALFDKATEDYVSFDIWLEYIQWAIGAIESQKDIRAICERALTAVGLQADRGILIWDVYREYEVAILTGLQGHPDARLPEKKAQTERIIALFKRELSLPLQGIESAFEEFHLFLVEWLGATPGEGVDHTTKSNFDYAMGKLKDLAVFEQAIADSPAPHLEAYRAYIEFEAKARIPSRMISIYERALTENCLNAELWLEYVTYLDGEVKQADEVIKAYSRAVRNCTWATQLWIQYLLAVERYRILSHDGSRLNDSAEAVESAWNQIDVIFGETLQGGYASASEGVELWLTYAYAMRRKAEYPHVLPTGEPVENLQSKADELSSLTANGSALIVAPQDGLPPAIYKDLATVLQKGADSLKEMFQADWDSTFVYRKSWAFISAKLCRNPSKARELWTEILKEGNGRYATMWLEYYGLERAYGFADAANLAAARDSCRKLLNKAIATVSDFPEIIFQTLIAFEQEEGTLKTLDEAMQRVKTQRRRVEERLAAQSAKGKQKHGSFAEKTLFEKYKPPDRKRKAEFEFNGPSPEKQQKISQLAKDFAGHFKQHRSIQEEEKLFLPPPTSANVSSETTSSKDSDGFAVPAMPAPSSSKDHRPTKPSASKPMPQGKQFAASVNSVPVAGATPAPPTTRDGKIDTSAYDRTVFVSNLDFKLPDPEGILREKFADCGVIKEIRLAKHRSGRFKGFAYVEFMSPDCVPAALSIDRAQVDGRPMYVSMAKDKSRRSGEGAEKGGEAAKDETSFPFTVGLERNKLFVRNIPLVVTEKELQGIFEPYGELKATRLCCNRSGKSKGYAYVEYANESDAAKALLKSDGTVVEGQVISVAISNPPKRGEKQSAEFAPPREGRGVPMDTTPSGSGHVFQPALGGQGSATGKFGAGLGGMEAEKKKERLNMFAPRAVVAPKAPSGVKHPTSSVGVAVAEEKAGVKKEVKEEDTGTTATAAQKSKLSNDEFRKMFLKK